MQLNLQKNILLFCFNFFFFIITFFKIFYNLILYIHRIVLNYKIFIDLTCIMFNDDYFRWLDFQKFVCNLNKLKSIYNFV